MLRKLLVARVAVIVLSCAVAIVGATHESYAENCAPPDSGCHGRFAQDCGATVITCPKPSDNTGGGNNGNTSTAAGCTFHGRPVECNNDHGWFNAATGCYYQQLDSQYGFDVLPPRVAGEKTPPGSTWYMSSCLNDDGTYAPPNYVALATPPAGYGPTPAELAQRALAKVHLDGADIGIAPSPNGAGLVGLPVYLWTRVTPNTWGPITASDTAGPLTVTITAKATQIVWDMGDGHSVTCANPGTPYDPSFEGNPSPTCGYTYTVTSRNQPDGRYHITATTSWRVEWTGGGANGVIDTTSQSQTSVRIDELQVVAR